MESGNFQDLGMQLGAPMASECLNQKLDEGLYAMSSKSSRLYNGWDLGGLVKLLEYPVWWMNLFCSLEFLLTSYEICPSYKFQALELLLQPKVRFQVF